MTDKLKKLIEDELESAYTHGRTEAESDYHDLLEMAKKKAYNDGVAEGKRVNEKGCEGCKYSSTSSYTWPCNGCSNNYLNLWKPKKKDDEIEFGDEVVDKYGDKGIVVSKDNTVRDELCVLFNGYDIPQNVFKGTCAKTGKHYDLDAFMEELKR